MAEFCQQCSIELFGEDYKDLAGLSTEEDTKKTTGAVVICEGCGYTVVDHEGRCMNPHCDKQHGLVPEADKIADLADIKNEVERGQ